MGASFFIRRQQLFLFFQTPNGGKRGGGMRREEMRMTSRENTRSRIRQLTNTIKRTKKDYKLSRMPNVSKFINQLEKERRELVRELRYEDK